MFSPPPPDGVSPTASSHKGKQGHHHITATAHLPRHCSRQRPTSLDTRSRWEPSSARQPQRCEIRQGKTPTPSCFEQQPICKTLAGTATHHPTGQDMMASSIRLCRRVDARKLPMASAASRPNVVTAWCGRKEDVGGGETARAAKLVNIHCIPLPLPQAHSTYPPASILNKK